MVEHEVGSEWRIVERATREVEARRRVPPRALAGVSAQANAPSSWLVAHWLALFNVLNGAMVAGTVLAPWFRSVGVEPVAAALYGFYRLQCPQRLNHSFFLFGEPMGMEQRMVAIYAGWLTAGVCFVALRPRVRPLPLAVAALAAVPMLVDVLAQTVDWRDGDPTWRVVTGVLFAVGSAWWGFGLLHALATRRRRHGSLHPRCEGASR